MFQFKRFNHAPLLMVLLFLGSLLAHSEEERHLDGLIIKYQQPRQRVLSTRSTSSEKGREDRFALVDLTTRQQIQVLIKRNREGKLTAGRIKWQLDDRDMAKRALLAEEAFLYETLYAIRTPKSENDYFSTLMKGEEGKGVLQKILDETNSITLLLSDQLGKTAPQLSTEVLTQSTEYYLDRFRNLKEGLEALLGAIKRCEADEPCQKIIDWFSRRRFAHFATSLAEQIAKKVQDLTPVVAP